MEGVGFFRDSKIWRYRFLIYLGLMIYFGYQAYQKRFGQRVVAEDIPAGGQEVVTPDGQRARVYKVDEFMKMHGTSLKEELKKRDAQNKPGHEPSQTAAKAKPAPGEAAKAKDEAPKPAE